MTPALHPLPTQPHDCHTRTRIINQTTLVTKTRSLRGLRPLRWGPLMAGPSIMTTRNMRGRHPLPLFALEQVGRTQVNPSNSITPGTAGDLLRPAPRLSAAKVPCPAAASFGRNYRVSLVKSIPDQGTRKTIQTMAAYMANIPNLGPLTKRERVREPTQTDREISQRSTRSSRRLNTSRDHRHLSYPVKSLPGITKT